MDRRVRRSLSRRGLSPFFSLACATRSATTDALRAEAARLHDLDAEQQQLQFYVDGRKLPAGIAISESPLANTADLEVHVVGKQRVRTNEGPNPGWSGRQFSGSRSAGGRPFSDGSAADGANTWWGEAGTSGGQRRSFGPSF